MKKLAQYDTAASASQHSDRIPRFMQQTFIGE